MRSLSLVKCGPPAPRAGKIKLASPPSAGIQIRSALAVCPPSNVLFSRSYALPRSRTIFVPSGDQAGLLYTASDFDNCTGVPPAAGIFQSCPPSLYQGTYAMDVPSADQ